MLNHLRQSRADRPRLPPARHSRASHPASGTKSQRSGSTATERIGEHLPGNHLIELNLSVHGMLDRRLRATAAAEAVSSRAGGGEQPGPTRSGREQLPRQGREKAAPDLSETAFDLLLPWSG